MKDSNPPGSGHADAPAIFDPVPGSDLVGQVTEQLARAICEGRLSPGQRLVEAAVARQMGISRAPLREAARRLEQRGLLVARPRRGFFVRDFAPQEIDDLYGLRLVLETYAAELACARATAADLDRLRARLGRLRALARDGAVTELVEADLGFHLDICELSGNRKLLGLFTDLTGEVRMIIALIGQVYDDPVRLAEAHAPLLEALAAGDRDRLRGEVDHHIRVAWQEVRDFFAARRARETRAEPPRAWPGDGIETAGG